MEFFANFVKVISCILFVTATALTMIKFLRELRTSNYNGAGINKKYNNDNLRVIITLVTLVLAARLVTFLLGYMAVTLTKNQNIEFFSSFQSIWDRWDSPHYIAIARDGYVNEGDARNFLVFYPLYPLLIKIVYYVVHNYYMAGILVSNISFVVAGFYLYKLTHLENIEDTAFRANKYMIIYPFAFFFGIAYTESLFIALTVMTVYYIRKRNWLIAGICGFLTVLTRNQGILILVPAFVEFVLYIKEARSYNKEKGSISIKGIVKNGTCLLIIPYGTLVYLFINKIVTGNWFEFLKIQKEHWSNSFGFFAENLKNHVLNMLAYDPSFRISLWIPQVVTFFFVIGLTIYGVKKLRTSYAAYMLAYILVSFSPTWLLSGPRYIAGLFPIYILLAIAAKNKVVDSILTIVFTMLLSFYAIAFALGAHVM